MQSLSYTLLEQIVAQSVHGILLVEGSGSNARIRYANAAYERLSGYSARELIGNAWNSQLAADSVGGEQEVLNGIVAGGAPGNCFLTCLAKDGRAWRCEVHLSRVGGAAGEASMVLAQHVPVPAKAEDIETAAATRDQRPGIGSGRPRATPSTALSAGMLSANQFLALLERDLAIARRHERALTLMLFEIAELEVYRQTFGSLAAESCARMVATQILGTFARSIDLHARLDETSFVVAVHEQPEQQSLRLARLVAEKTARLHLPNPRGSRSKHIQVLTVVVPAEPARDDAQRLIEKARAALGNDPVRSAAATP